MTIDQAIDAAIQHHRAGRLGEAEAIYRQILQQHPDYPDALHLLGALASQTGNHQAAVDLISRAISKNPKALEFHENLARALIALGRIEEAIAAYRNALQIAPRSEITYVNLADAMARAGRHDEAAQVLHQAIEKCQPSAELHYNLGNALRLDGKTQEAIEAYRRALQLRSGFAQAHSNLAKTLKDSGRVRESVAEFRHAIAAAPDWALPHYDLGFALLALGEFEQGWQEHEWRYRSRDIGNICYDFPEPRWDGSPLDGRCILIHSEQGFGDTIQFCRYVPKILTERGGEVIFQCQSEVATLMRTLSPPVRVVTRDEPLPEFDLHCPLLSLPLKFQTTLENIPAVVPYLRADPSRVQSWREKLDNLGPALKVGIAWAGHPDHKQDKQRSLPLKELAPLAELQGVTLVSLQKGRSDLEKFVAADWTNELCDFSDTAALIEGLDLVITVDTSIAHLAGALGKGVWVLLPFIPEWRWMLDREDSPWYPTMRLFRQLVADEWGRTVQAVVSRLKDQISRRVKELER